MHPSGTLVPDFEGAPLDSLRFSKGGDARFSGHAQIRRGSSLAHPRRTPSCHLGAPSDTIGAQSDTIEAQSDTIGAPSDTIGTPSDTVGMPSAPVGTPNDTIEAPIDPVGTPIDTACTPIDTAGLPACTSGVSAYPLEVGAWRVLATTGAERGHSVAVEDPRDSAHRPTDLAGANEVQQAPARCRRHVERRHFARSSWSMLSATVLR
jgi:hypothetical protein